MSGSSQDKAEYTGVVGTVLAGLSAAAITVSNNRAFQLWPPPELTHMVQLAHSEKRRMGTDRVQRVLQLALQLDNMGTWDPVRLAQEKERRC